MWDQAAGGVIGGLFGYLGAQAQIGAAKDIANKQLAAVEKMRQQIYSELEPSSVNAQASQADVARATNSLALQSQIDPAISAARYGAAGNILDQILNPTGQAEQVASQLVSEIQPSAASDELKNRLIDQALTDLNLGATLPSDIQAELVKTGLEQSAQAGLGTRASGAAGDLARRLLGTGALALQQQRVAEATKLNESANNLANQRAAVLTSIFPSLKGLQTQTLEQQLGVYNTANQALPDVGLSGSNLANILLARVGADQTLTAQQSDVLASQGVANAAALGNLYGSLGGAASDVTKAVYGSLFPSK